MPAGRTVEERENLTQDDVMSKMVELRKSPSLQQEYLENVLKKADILPAVKAFAAKNLAQSYAKNNFWNLAAKALENAMGNKMNYTEKKDLYMNAGVYRIKEGEFLAAEDNFKRAMEEAPKADQEKIKKEARNLFLKEAELLEKASRFSLAGRIYERLLHNSSDTAEKKIILEKLIYVYTRLSKIQELFAMKEMLKSLGSSVPAKKIPAKAKEDW